MSPFTVLILIAVAVGAFGFIDEETKLNSTDELSSSEAGLKQIGEWEGRIFGGRNARRGQFPHQVAILRGPRLQCGGSILNRLFVLTAGHCTVGQTAIPANIRVVVGALYFNNDGIIHEVHSVHSHPEFSLRNRANDISIIRTLNNILFDTRFVRPVRLPTFNVPEAGNYTVYVSGWGQVQANRSGPAEILQFKDALTLNREECIAQWGENGRFVYENTVCVQNPVGRGACFGDSGNPLISQRGVQVGIAIWTLPCARGLPDVYTNVWSHLEWIRATIRANWD